MQIERLVHGDHDAARACAEVSLAVLAADDPAGPPVSARVARCWYEHPYEPAQTWFVPGEIPGSAVAVCQLRLPDLEDRARAGLSIDVHPAFRRRGIGGSLLRHAAERAAQDGRSVLGGEVTLGSAGEAFAGRLAARPGLADARRVLVLASLPRAHVAGLRDSAARAAAGYTLLSWAGRTPEEYLAGFAGVFNAMNDGPRDVGREDRVWDAQRVRSRIDDQTDLYGSRSYSIAAVHDATGEMAAVTRVTVDPEIPQWGRQLITAVTRQHRGHRLGLLVKAAMLDRLAAAEPAMARMVTWNAAANRHMIAINEALGYELLDPQTQHYEFSVADVLAASAGQLGAVG
jgi:GNAT superfamily N-acetyltransferase